jgi:hypothetical protein
MTMYLDGKWHGIKIAQVVDEWGNATIEVYSDEAGKWVRLST